MTDGALYPPYGPYHPRHLEALQSRVSDVLKKAQEDLKHRSQNKMMVAIKRRNQWPKHRVVVANYVRDCKI